MDERIKAFNQRLTILKQQLRLITLYPESFVQNLGKRGTQEKIDDILDEIISLNEEKQEYEKNED